LEIRDERWQNAIEGYLHNQKFYLLGEPTHFLAALRVYDQEKHKQNLHSFGLVDVEKLIARDMYKRAGSLAEYVTTVNPHARVLADYLLGRIIGCADLETIRDHDIAITPGCMLYQSYVARQLDPARYRVPFIGKQEAIIKQIQNAKEELDKLEQQINLVSTQLDSFNAAPVFISAINAN